MTNKPRVLIEDWLPVAELGDESRRERTISVAIPPLSRIHVWWARRPLAASAGVVLAGLLPAWSEHVQREVVAFLDDIEEGPRLAVLHPRPSMRSQRYQGPCEAWYRDWVLHLCGIWGDPVSARRQYDAAVASGIRIANPYNYKQAYKNQVELVHVRLLHHLLKATWGDALPVVLDPTAGGGSIPFAASRLGLPTIANDLNGIAATILESCVALPASFGTELSEASLVWGRRLTERVADALRPYFPSAANETIEFYLFANSVMCPRTGNLVPLSPDWWLRKKVGKEAAVRLVVERDGEPLREPEFEVLLGTEAKSGVSQGTISRGKGISPYDNLVIDEDYIKAEAQAGRLSQVMYAVVVRDHNGDRTFRAPTQADRDAVELATLRLGEVRAEWEEQGFLPTEAREKGFSDRSYVYGMTTWSSLFSPRQLLVHGTFAEKFHEISQEIREDLDADRADAVLMLLSLLQGKALNWNSRLSSWNVNQQSARSVFDRHDFSFKWTFTEYQGADGLYPWTLHVLDNAQANADLIAGTGLDLVTGQRLERDVQVLCGSAADLRGVTDASVTHVCMDPPYYDNVMYAELADFFYVWEKHTVGLIRPSYFGGTETDKANEAVANPTRFEAMGRRKNELATLDYESKMTAIFAEARRVLRDDGVLSVMFTHKRAEAWDTLGMGLLQAGFTIETSWPVNTEAENSLHQANMNSAASTIMLVCRKRISAGSAAKVFLDDIEGEIRQAARAAATRFQDDGIEGVDLLLSTYGPTLSVISSHWPVYSSTPDESGRDRLLRPEEALDLAREEVVRLRRQRIVGKAAQIDGYTDFVLLAWDIFSAREFPFDTARLLALAVGGHDVDDLERAKIIEKKSGAVRLLTPKERLRRDADSALPGVRPEAKSFDAMIDAVDTVLYIGDVDGMAAAKVFMDKVGLTTDSRFHNTVQGLVNTIPRARVKGDWVIPEAGLLSTLVTAYLGDYVTLPADEAEPDVTEQVSLFDSAE